MATLAQDVKGTKVSSLELLGYEWKEEKEGKEPLWLHGLISRYMLSTWSVASSPKNCWHKPV